MPTYQHRETRKRFLFIHVPRTAGRFLQENIKQNLHPEMRDVKSGESLLVFNPQQEDEDDDDEGDIIIVRK